MTMIGNLHDPNSDVKTIDKAKRVHWNAVANGLTKAKLPWILSTKDIKPACPGDTLAESLGTISSVFSRRWKSWVTI